MTKKHIYPIFLIAFFLFMFINPGAVISGATDGLLLWYRKALPVLFPFLLITGLLTDTGSIAFINKILSPFLVPLLGISDVSSFLVVCGFLCGFPVGAKNCSDLTDKGLISSAEGEYLLSFCNNVSPSFITGYVAMQSLHTPELSIVCFLLPTFSALTCSFFFRRWYPLRTKGSKIIKMEKPKEGVSFSEILDKNILSSCDSITKIGGYMMAFSVLLTFMKNFSFQNPIWSYLILPGIELTSGVNLLSQTPLPFSLCFPLVMAHCSFGGICALFQTKCMIRSQNWSLFRYTTEKLITAMVTSLYAYLYLKLF